MTGHLPESRDRRCILHVDMDAFFASVEQLDNPALRGKPVLVGHDGPRGVVAAASYEARAFGCHSAQPIAVARRNCPQAIIVPVRGGRYREVSEQVFAIFERYTPIIEPLSIDEAFLDVTGSQRFFGGSAGSLIDGEKLARQLKDRIRRETLLTASIGVAGNKFLAKLASDLRKPDGLAVIAPEDVSAVLGPLPIARIWGIGPKTAEKIIGLGIRTISDLLRVDPDVLGRRIGDEADHYLRLARGLDDRQVTPDREAKSIGHEQTFETDLNDPLMVRKVLLGQTEQVAARLRRNGLIAGGITVKIRYGDFKTVTRSRVLVTPSDVTADLWQAARALFDGWAVDYHPVRLIGVSAAHLGSARGGQLELFGNPVTERQRHIDQAVDEINHRFKATDGRAVIRRAGADDRLGK